MITIPSDERGMTSINFMGSRPLRPHSYVPHPYGWCLTAFWDTLAIDLGILEDQQLV
jgi:hypothetical protein